MQPPTEKQSALSTDATSRAAGHCRVQKGSVVQNKAIHRPLTKGFDRALDSTVMHCIAMTR